MTSCAATIVGLLLAGSALAGPYLGQAPPDRTPRPFNVAMIAPDRSVPVFAPDRMEVFWAQRAPGESTRRIYRAFMSAGGWSAPKLTDFTSGWDGENPQFTTDGRHLMFTSTRPLSSDRGLRSDRLWMVERTATGWSSPHPLPAEINGDHVNWQASVDDAGNVYFGSERTGSLGRDDIFVCRRTADGYRPAESLAPPINTTCYESTPFMAADGDFLLFSRACYGADAPDVPTGLLVSFRLPDGGWSDPQPVPLAGIDTDNAVCPTITPDGRFLFFLVLSPEQSQVYWVDAAVIDDQDPRGDLSRASKEP